MSGKHKLDVVRNQPIDPEIVRDCCRAVIKSYCYSGGYCDKACMLSKICNEQELNYAYDVGAFDKWSLDVLKKAAEIVQGKVDMYCLGVKQLTVIDYKTKSK